MNKILRVGACQTPEIIGDLNAVVRCILSFVEEARGEKVDLFLFLNVSCQVILLNTLTLSSVRLSRIRQRWPMYWRSARLLNRPSFWTSLSIEPIAILILRCTGESLFKAGNEYAIFDLKGVRFGINICYDTQFAEVAAVIGAQGAQLLLVPARNMMKKETAEKWKPLHNLMRAERAKEIRMWLISADVTGAFIIARFSCTIQRQNHYVPT